MKKLLLIGLSIIALTLTSCESETLKSCKKIYKQQEKFVKNCDDCVELENFYITTGEQWGWEDYKYFIGLYAPEEFDLSVLDVLDNEERTTLKKIHISLKNTVDNKLKAMNCCSEDLILYEYTMKAKKLIINYFSKTLNDFNSYEMVEFGDLIDITEWDRYLEAHDKLNKISKEYLTQSDRAFNNYLFCGASYSDYKQFNEYVEKGKYAKKVMNKLDNESKGRQDEMDNNLLGWCMYHKYRVKNEFGGISLQENYFYFNPEVSQMVNRTDVFYDVLKMIE